jgi:hypothetical protein
MDGIAFVRLCPALSFLLRWNEDVDAWGIQPDDALREATVAQCCVTRHVCEERRVFVQLH